MSLTLKRRNASRPSSSHIFTVRYFIFVVLPKLASHYLKPLQNLLDATRSGSFGVWLVVNGAAARSLSDRENRPPAQRAVNSGGQSQMITDMQTPPKPPVLTSFNHGNSPFAHYREGLPPTTTASVPRNLLPSLNPLSAVYRDRSHSLQIIDEKNEDSIHRYLEWEMKVPRLNEIHGYLWLAGRPMCARPLHRQAMLGRELVITEQVDLHMVRQESRIFLKPLPEFLLSADFWTTYLCRDTDLHECARGLLLSYVWLVCSKSDLRIAQRGGLLDSEITWEGWRYFTKTLLSSVDTSSLEGVNKRYHYRELRLSRLNWIHRMTIKKPSLTRIVRGYMYEYNQYSDFVRRNFAWVIVVFVYITIVLTAMQVGLATDRLGKDDMFQNASYGFTVLSILTPLIILFIIGLNLLSLSVFNILGPVCFKRRIERSRRVDLKAETQSTA